ncbi:tetraacyldisaccharide 4'-kinase [Larkinella rosea]|uniref:tetraacyldisaccharide 4'-kinase n=1 Tax=Larkinella rosea TaxID=2025312 RepID=UPI001E475D7E|nr:tetraacyldisaccharide 4'-kinase [Larkinella rosea]
MLNPLNWLYGGITDIRNFLYDSRITKSLSPPIYTISVGNLTVGGTGKTPHVDYLVHLLKKSGPIATLSRGYGRRTRGFRIATDADTADTIGDEPLLLYRKHGRQIGTNPGSVTVSVGEKRAEAISKLVMNNPDLQVIILDDAFQHRPVQPHLNILLTDYNRPFYRDQPFPGGRLRERRHGARRADVIVVTKCPDNLRVADQGEIEERIRGYSRADIPVFFTGIQYGNPVCFAEDAIKSALKRVVLVTGIAQSEPLEAYVKSHFSMAQHLQFADHYRYTMDDLEKIQRLIPTGGAVLTTEKDFVKLAPLVSESGAEATAFYYLPIEVRFLSQEDQFQKISTKFLT